jgi:chemotaxis family two-component system sensor kinase Cph1
MGQLIDHLLAFSRLQLTRTRPLATIEVGACDRDGAAAYYVRDNGVGFDMRYASKLFKVCQRLHDAADYQGTSPTGSASPRTARKPWTC